MIVQPLAAQPVWDPTLALADVEKLERVQLALRRGDIKAAVKEAKVFELLPLAGE